VTHLDPKTVAQIKASQDNGYSLGDVARHFAVSKSTVSRIWATEAPRITTARTPRAYLAEDAVILQKRGMSAHQIAAHLGVSRQTVWRALKDA
jgi:transposase